MKCEKCGIDKSNVKEYTLSVFGTWLLCTPCLREVENWIRDVITNVQKSLNTFITGEF